MGSSGQTNSVIGHMAKLIAETLKKNLQSGGVVL